MTPVAIGVERVEVLRCADRQFFDLALGHVRGSPLLDRFGCLVERRPRGLLGGHLAHLVRVLFLGQPS